VIKLITDKYNISQFLSVCPTFYGIPKIHNLGAPLRPIVSQINGPTSRLSELGWPYTSRKKHS